ncbi:MAG TPA: hypothetical protein VEV42_17575 [Pyrinomonadaceae bacterium]|nr:hypothetical protein [Pyrinomonadaceae bacterium]
MKKMLPDFPKLRIELNRKLRSDFEKQTHIRAPLVAEIKVVAQHEGKGGSYEAEDGQVKRIEPQHVRVPVEAPVVSEPSFMYEEALKMIHKAAEEMARKQTKILFETVHAAVEEVGNSLDAEGQPISAELILKMWEKIHFDFDKLGKPKMPTLVFNPIQSERVKKELERIHTEPQLIKRRKEIMNVKLVDFYDRESRRKLVD